MYSIAPLFPQLRADFHALAIAMLRDLRVADPDVHGLCVVQLGAHYVDSGQARVAESLMADYVKDHGAADNYGQAAARLWGIKSGCCNQHAP